MNKLNHLLAADLQNAVDEIIGKNVNTLFALEQDHLLSITPVYTHIWFQLARHRIMESIKQ